jgi:phosphate transport system permease protein
VDEQAQASGVMAKHFNTGLFVYGASSRPEAAGVGVALIGSLYMMLIVLRPGAADRRRRLDLSRGVRPKNKLTDLIEVNINNLAAVPSIVYGLLGLAVFINFARPAALGIASSAAWC